MFVAKVNFRWTLNVTGTFNYPGAARVETASLRWIDQAGWFPRRNILKFIHVFRIRVRRSSQESVCIGMGCIVDEV